MTVNENRNKILYFKNLIKKTILALQKYKNLDILLACELNSTLEFLNNIFSILTNLSSEQSIDDKLEEIGNQIINILKNYGTENVEDIIMMFFGKEYLETLKDSDKFSLIKKYIHPINCRIVTKTGLSVSSDDYIMFEKDNLTCLNIDGKSKFQLLVYGIKIIVINNGKLLVINGIVDDIGLMFLDNTYISNKQKRLINSKLDIEYISTEYKKYLKTLSLKDMLINTDEELINNYIKTMLKVNEINKMLLSETIDSFIGDNLYNQREILIKLLIKDGAECKYLAYLLYDLLSNENNGIVDTYEQTLLYDSLPWELRSYFNEAMKQTVQYTNNLNNTSSNKLPLEQQICLLKTDDSVKEKAMIKLKEIRSKSEDSGAKAKLFLDGLLKIPFGIYCEENIVQVSKDIKKSLYFNIEKMIKIFKLNMDIDKAKIKNNYELKTIHDNILDKNYHNIDDSNIGSFILSLNQMKRSNLIKTVNNINGIIKKEGIKANKLVQSGKNANYIICSIKNFVENNKDVVKRNFNIILNTSFNNLELDTVLSNTHAIVKDNLLIKDYINDIGVVLDNSVHGHKDAKNQIQRIIGQWINGKNSGYCFGFEGPPGVGKTSLAKKGLSKCLKDNNGKSRPFSFVAMGGSSNGSILEGHSYTYVGSTWGKIVDILIDSKCMNPIIFIDELDKISKTENGKEIIGILTHLIDSTQNDKFQDKYFCGIDLDLSKALFIFSYNDETLIDRILLDRIHRIKFDFLSLNDKLEIARNFILPDIYDKMGLENIISIDDDVIKYIIETYTDEAGVRKLKELIYEIMGEININILKKDKDYSLPIIITKENIRYEYLRNHNYILSKCVNVCPCVGLINGLWANSLGKGGILPIEASFFPSNIFFELKLTGMQGDVMKESMNVAKTLAVNLSDKSNIDEIITNNKNNNFKGIHLHCPEGAVPKDGPSAGAAITVVIYSLLNSKKISNEIAITGEITLQGNITAIGGLDKKIMGGINAGVKKFLYPKDNEQDFNEFIRKYKDNIESTIEFVAIDNINDVIDIIILD